MNIYENLRRSKHKNNNVMDKEMSVTELVKELGKVIDGKKPDRNVINRIENGSQEPTPQQLVAYSKVFDVSVDFILDNQKPKSETENKKQIAKYLGLSDDTIESIVKLKPERKMILDKMISRYGFLYVLGEIRNLLGYNALKPHLKLMFDEKLPMNDGAEIDQFLNDAINDNTVSTFFNETVSKRINDIVQNTMSDKDLQAYFGELDKKSKIRGVLSAKYLPKLSDNKGSDE